MSFDVLKEEVQSLPLELQNNIEMYALFVIEQFKKASQKNTVKQSASEIVQGLTGIIKDAGPVTISDIRSARLKEKYGY
ncbi:MAG: hypothetical protein VZR56_03345 [Treponema sp.]|nr:hypothetical protein [Treponema sp.]